ncbi:MAG: hypothetical protein NT094_00340, partial [Candidatus Staskawiczbacteria bacterium]|nr:hypothetical protein [Candidatus Staskawiczbacteria bacterium]
MIDYKKLCVEVCQISKEVGNYIKEESLKLRSTDIEVKGIHNFVTYVDNKTFPDEEKHFEASDRTILGLQRFIKDPNMLIDFFKKRKGPVEKSSVRVLSDAELKQMGLTSASGDQRKAIDKSIEKLEEYENNGMIIDSDDYGRIVVDIGKEVPCGFDAAKFWGCGAYLNWSPEMGSFFISTVDDLQHKFSQGKPVRQTMWIKPPKDPRPLKINLEKILSTLTNGKLEAEGELEDYLETVDLLGDSGKINKNNNLSKDMAKRTPEAAPKPPEEIKNLESAPFEEGEKEVVQSMTERYGAEHKIDEETMDAVSGFLSKDHEKAYQDFALQWFQDNQDKVKERIGNIPPNASEDWKINMVLSKEGMNASAEINNPEYKDDERYEAIIKKIGRIRVLETGIKKEPPSPETPFLLLNYLQASVEGKRKEVRKLRAAEARGNENAGIEADSKENEIKEVFGTMKELTEKTMDEDLRGNAEEKVVRSRGFEEKEDSVASGINAKKIEVEDRRNDELMTKEWERFSRLPEQQRGKYQKQLKLGEGVLTKATFGDAIKMAANRDSGINGQAFYAMLEQGLRPYEATTSRKKYLLFGPRTVTMARQNGTSKEMSVKERDATIESSKTSYTEKIGLRAQTELEDTWEKDFEKKINIEIEKRVKVIAESPGTAEEEVEKIYEEARQRIITEYALKQANKVPKTKEQLAEIKKNFEEKAEGKNVNDFMSAALFKKGRLENLGDDFDENDRREMGGFLRDWGFKADKNTMGFITPAEY